MIRVKRNIDENEEIKGEFPRNAKKIDSTKHNFRVEVMFHIILVIMALAMIIKLFVNQMLVVSIVGILVGMIIGILLSFVHIWMEAIFYPKEADVVIGRVCKTKKGQISFAVLTSYPMPRSRYIIMRLLPLIVLGIIPFIGFILSPAYNTVLNGALWGISSIGMDLSLDDINDVIDVLRGSQKNDKILGGGYDLFRINEKEEI